MSPPRKMFINAADPEEFRVAIVEEGVLEDYALEAASREQTKGNIYKGVVVNIEPSLQAAFLNYGGERHGFLPLSEVHPEYYQEKVKGKAKARIQQVLRKGQELIVQVYKEETPTKGAYLSTYVSLAGRNLVLLVKQSHLGVSRKIEKEEERQRLKELAQKLGLPPEMGLIIRTVGEEGKIRDLTKDLQALLKTWGNIKKTAAEQAAPYLLYKDLDLISRTVRDYFSAEVKTILVDDKEAFQQLKTFLRLVAPQRLPVLKLYHDKLPIFSRYRLEEQIDCIYAPRVPLKSGGGIVINPTEALVAIDVNSGRSLGHKEIEETAFKTNLEAAEEVARQLRLRDLGGLVVIDFIDMKDKKHQKEVEQVLKQSLKKDKARVTLGHMSKFGLLELSRQRLRPAAETTTYMSCPTCMGRGSIKSVEALSLSLLRQISSQAAQNQIQEVRAVVPIEVANFLLNQKRKDILALEEQQRLKIFLTAKEGLAPEEMQVEFVKREGTEPKAVAEPKPAQESKPGPETKPPLGSKKSGESKRPSRPRRRSSKPKPKAEPQGESPEGAPSSEPQGNPPE